MIDSNNIHDLAAPNEDMRKIIARETQRINDSLKDKINDSLNNPSNMRDLVVFQCQTMMLEVHKHDSYPNINWDNLSNKELLNYYRQLASQYYNYYDTLD